MSRTPVESVGHDDDAITDKRGGVVFHEIRNRVPRLQRWAGNLLNASREGVHASLGIHAHVFAFGNGLEGSAVSNGLVEDWTGSPEHMESRIVATPSQTPVANPNVPSAK